MNGYAFSFVGHDLIARADATLWWPSEELLCVSDLHLGKSERMARRGGTLLPPYETQETLWRLDQALAATEPKTVICLGDSFDDLGAALALPDDMRITLARMQAGRSGIWIEGNHDPGPVDLGGAHRDEFLFGNLAFRHIARDGVTGEVSGHYHPKTGVPGTAQRPCFLIDQDRLIMPAFGAYTGGLSSSHATLCQLMSDDALAVLTGSRAIPLPMNPKLRRPRGPFRQG